MHNVFQDLPSIIAAVNAGGIIRVLGAIAILIGLWRWLGKGNRKTGMILVLLGACAVMYTVSLPITGHHHRSSRQPPTQRLPLPRLTDVTHDHPHPTPTVPSMTSPNQFHHHN